MICGQIRICLSLPRNTPKSFSSAVSGASSRSASDTASGLVLKHGRPLLGRRTAAERFAGDLQHQPVADRPADARDRGAIGVRVEAMRALPRRAHAGGSSRRRARGIRRPCGRVRRRSAAAPGGRPWSCARHWARPPATTRPRDSAATAFRLSAARPRRVDWAEPVLRSTRHRTRSMSHILHRTANIDMPVAVSGSGIEIVDADGRRYLDASGGAAVSCLGHGHPTCSPRCANSSTRLPIRIRLSSPPKPPNVSPTA